MNYGMYISASAASVQMAKQDVLANNLANVSTVGFRPDFLTVGARDVARIEDGLTFEDSDRLLERLGAGVVPGNTRMSATQGPIEKTGRGLDAAIDGDGFFVVQAERGSEGLRVTRDGRFAIGADGTLVTATDGTPLVGMAGGSITVDRTKPVDIDSNGFVFQGTVAVGQLRVADVAGSDRLVKIGKGLMRMPEGEELRLNDSASRIVPRALEGSGVNTITTLMDSTGASRAAQSNLRMISLIGENMQMAINQLGRVS